MIRKMTGLCVTAGLAVTLFISHASGQDGVLRVKVFTFTANGHSLPGGVYKFKKDTKGFMTLSSADDMMMVRVITPLERGNNADNRVLKFDKVDGKLILSEIWIGQNGALVQSHAKKGEADKHEVVWLTAQATASGD